MFYCPAMTWALGIVSHTNLNVALVHTFLHMHTYKHSHTLLNVSKSWRQNPGLGVIFLNTEMKELQSECLIQLSIAHLISKHRFQNW